MVEKKLAICDVYPAKTVLCTVEQNWHQVTVEKAYLVETEAGKALVAICPVHFEPFMIENAERLKLRNP